ncbi:hypothetical protein ABFS82_13G014200 [Erythranthe guttata]|uniref:uncharacterized protein LOC105961758 n=1 Tax=Erythranthe guttata TaxID=4155 RepID=UPI00064E06A7|nr:PREDICTED: uncharacterized protein LOC105961758 [Erythranthe guttata]|eukprot:XP_012841471.1 PREDICTED: uncharacterized protein LOC105961758 [Erythranthe guttata]
MKNSENTRAHESVIAKLMGFDEVLLPPQQPVREKRRLLSENYVRKAASIGLPPRSLHGVRISKSKKDNVVDKVKKVKRSPKSLSRGNDEERRSCGKKGDDYVRRNVLRYLQKLEYYRPKGDFDELRVNYMIDKPCIFSTSMSIFKPNLMRLLDKPEDLKLDRHSTYKQLVNNGIVSTRHSCIACTRTMNRICRQEQGRSKFWEVSSKPGNVNESEKQSSDLLTKKSKKVDVCRRHQSIDEMLILADEKSSEGDSKLMEQTVSYAECVGDTAYASAESFNGGVSSRISGGPHSNSEYAQEVLSEEASLDELSDENLTYSNLKKTSQHSPDSVLEPCDIQNSSNFEYFDRIGLQMQLQALNIESEETYSEGSIMAVSDEDDFFDEFRDLSHDGRKIKRWLGDDYQSRNYSYMIDVLDESGFYGTKLLTDLKYPICPSVFDALEKTYGKQTSWQKCERQLLFDCINSALNFRFSARRRFRPCLKRGEVEDEIWGVLTRQEKETGKDFCDKDLEKWLGFEEGVDIVCTEMENSLFDDLVMELVSSSD